MILYAACATDEVKTLKPFAFFYGSGKKAAAKHVVSQRRLGYWNFLSEKSVISIRAANRKEKESFIAWISQQGITVPLPLDPQQATRLNRLQLEFGEKIWRDEL